MPKLSSLLATLQRKLKAFWSFSLTDKLLVLVIFVLLGLARMAILVLPFRYYSGLLGCYRQIQIYTPILTTEQAQQVRRLGRLVRSTAVITPWESLCLVQALVASVLLRLARLPYILHFGLAKNLDPNKPDPMNAHAWVTAGPVPVTGGRSLFQFAVVGSYVSPLLQKDST